MTIKMARRSSRKAHPQNGPLVTIRTRRGTLELGAAPRGMIATGDSPAVEHNDGQAAVGEPVRTHMDKDREAEQDREGRAGAASPATRPQVDAETAGGGRQSAWATLGRSAGQPGDHVKGCRCCFPPDQMFEDACSAIVALNVPGIGSLQAEKFVRLCGGGVGSMTLSKGKAKTAQKLRKGMPLSPAEVAVMQGQRRACEA